MFKSLLIANRGEIAVRLIRACREMGIRAVAVYSEADAGALHVRLADEALPIGPAPAAESYLRGERIIAAAKAARAQAIHPGYGFLSENAGFAAAVQAAGLIFVGPPPEAIRLMGDKVQARRLMAEAGVPVVEGFVPHPSLPTPLPTPVGRGEWRETQYPLLVKAALGGGGRGMRIVRTPDELAEALATARREAAQAFGDGAVFVEKYVEGARHIEIQVLGDAHGNLTHLGERECSVQRRHQKVIEEAPSPLLDEDLRAQMAEAALRAARAVGYRSAGTVEFIVDPAARRFYFLEMNTRLQVEHPVTEAVTGIDLAQMQLRIAAGEPLPFKQSDASARGHALECRLYAEAPGKGFAPSAGRILHFGAPGGPGVRMDTGYAAGDEVTHHYDALLAKVIAHGADRAAAVRRMQAALRETVVLGVETNLAFLQAALAHPVFERGEATTAFLADHFAAWRPEEDGLPDEALAAAALAALLGPQSGNHADGPARNAPGLDPWARADGFRLGG